MDQDDMNALDRASKRATRAIAIGCIISYLSECSDEFVHEIAVGLYRRAHGLPIAHLQGSLSPDAQAAHDLLNSLDRRFPNAFDRKESRTN